MFGKLCVGLSQRSDLVPQCVQRFQDDADVSVASGTWDHNGGWQLAHGLEVGIEMIGCIAAERPQSATHSPMKLMLGNPRQVFCVKAWHLEGTDPSRGFQTLQWQSYYKPCNDSGDDTLQ